MPRSSSSCESDVTKLLAATCEDNEAGVKFLPHSQYRSFTTNEAIRKTLKEQGLSTARTDRLVLRICNETRPAKCIYLTILRMEEPKKLIPLLKNNNFSDNDLPITFRSDGRGSFVPENKSGASTSDITGFFKGWKQPLKESFRNYQCYFLAPVLNTSQFHYDLVSNIPLPLVKKESSKTTGFSSVAKVTFHPDHTGDVKISSKTRSLALKRLNGADDLDMLRVHRTELDNLGILRGLGLSHLIRPIAAFTSHQRSQETSFLFQWADMGNLRDFWNSQTCTFGDLDMTRWMLRQMRGVCDALRLLADNHFRHSDLKPENLLCFYEDGELVIKITDVGISKVHLENTTKRPYATDAMHSSRKYSAPEFEGIDKETKLEMSLNTPFLEPGQQSTRSKLSRKFDIWSFGCIYIEFLTWIQFGVGVASPKGYGLKNFDKRLEEVHADRQYWSWSGSRNDFVVNREVINQLNELRAKSSLPELLNLIQGSMLVHVDNRATAEDSWGILKSICEQVGADTGPPAAFTHQDKPKVRPIPSARRAEPPSHFPPPATRLSFGMNSSGMAQLENGMTFVVLSPDPPTVSSAAHSDLDTGAASNYVRSARDPMF